MRTLSTRTRTAATSTPNLNPCPGPTLSRRAKVWVSTCRRLQKGVRARFPATVPSRRRPLRPRQFIRARARHPLLRRRTRRDLASLRLPPPHLHPHTRPSRPTSLVKTRHTANISPSRHCPSPLQARFPQPRKCAPNAHQPAPSPKIHAALLCRERQLVRPARSAFLSVPPLPRSRN